MKLYQYLEGCDDYAAWKVIDDAWEKGEAPEGTRVFKDMCGDETGEYMVPVEPCVHGNYARHFLQGTIPIVCPGAGLEDTK